MNTPDADAVPTEETVVAPAEAPKSKLGIILGVFVVAALAILGTQYFLQSQIPKGEAEYEREASDGDTGVEASGGSANRDGAL